MNQTFVANSEQTQNQPLLSCFSYSINRYTNLVSPTQISLKDISVIIPVKNNQKGIENFLEKFFQTHTEASFPREIIIVDNNSTPKIFIPHKFLNSPLPIILISCTTVGSAAARNAGSAQASGSWLLFTDSDCVPTEMLIQGYCKSLNGAVGYAGKVQALGKDALSSYYETQETLVAKAVIEEGIYRPVCLITANALVWKPAFEKVGGFAEVIDIAAGEDVDLSFKLLEVGDLSYALDSLVLHDYGDGISAFVRRFFRYGRGINLINKLHNLNWLPTPFVPNKPTWRNWIYAYLQYSCSIAGYWFQQLQP
ncbi:MAG TPA: glycosyl transferase [Cyanobacteria bacterium UBA12227]|nr:glycosyl transferase [Cyanobacteria bacterium UBA12227]HAX90332.1 glycosyl transferase [Cyanobacteria bacterium UBA11370]HBY78665.1 glycosyl transferase [Cyanobacteria bacterium UBA11148]